jgi:hypothetical protein
VPRLTSSPHPLHIHSTFISHVRILAPDTCTSSSLPPTS